MDRDALEDQRTMRYWIAMVLREARERSGDDQRQVAILAGVDAATINRFEHGYTWPNKLDRIVAAYAMLTGVNDGRDFWEKAVRRYVRDGRQPLLGELTPAQRSLRLALEAAQRQTQRAAGSRGKPTSTPRNREAG